MYYTSTTRVSWGQKFQKGTPINPEKDFAYRMFASTPVRQQKSSFACAFFLWRLFLVASLRISGFRSPGHLLGLTWLSPEMFYTRDVSCQRAFSTTNPLHQRNFNTWNSLDFPSRETWNVLPQRRGGFVLPSAHMKYIKEIHQTHHTDDGVLFQCTSVLRVLPKWIFVKGDAKKCHKIHGETLPPVPLVVPGPFVIFSSTNHCSDFSGLNFDWPSRGQSGCFADLPSPCRREEKRRWVGK